MCQREDPHPKSASRDLTTVAVPRLCSDSRGLKHLQDSVVASPHSNLVSGQKRRSAGPVTSLRGFFPMQSVTSDDSIQFNLAASLAAESVQLTLVAPLLAL